MMTLAEKMARANDREEAAQKGEPDPWEQKGDDYEQFRAERIACMVEVLKAMRNRSADEFGTDITWSQLWFWQDAIDAAIEEAR